MSVKCLGRLAGGSAGLALLCGMLVGCDGGKSGDGTMVKPEVDPAVQAKASMDFYQNQMKGGNKAAPKK